MISVCIATYNGKKYIKEQMKSILNQLDKEDEVIVSDDGSEDDTLSIIRSLNDSRIKIFHHTRTSQKYVSDYVSQNFENALQYAKGEFIFLSDSDDVWLPQKVNLMTECLQNSVLVLSDCKIVDQKLNTVYHSYFERYNPKASIFKTIMRNNLLGCCMAFRKELLAIALPFPVGKDIWHDKWLVIIAMHIGKVTFLKKVLSLYRQNEQSTLTAYGIKHSFKEKLLWRFWLFTSFIQRCFLRKR
jgi:glycosyltransferase involved in cell wall biosynthesis